MTKPDPTIRVTFQPSLRSVHVTEGTLILEAAVRAGLAMDTPCGGAGTCGKCRVQMRPGIPSRNGNAQPTGDGRVASEAWCQACQTTIATECTIIIPADMRRLDAPQIVVGDASQGETGICPAVRKVYVELPEPTRADNSAALMRIEQAVGRCRANLPQLQALSHSLDRRAYCGTVVLIDDSLAALETGNTTSATYGIAFDLGTTTLAGTLLNLQDGSELALTSRMNPQVSRGDDVLSRIQHAARDSQALDELQRNVVQALSEMVQELCDQAQVATENVYEVTLAGNTTMEHLLCGINPAALGQIPFLPAFNRGLSLSVAELPLPIHAQGRIYVFPVIGGFVGGDTVAAMLCTEHAMRDKPVLMVDVGTNGEIVLAHAGHLWAASTAAGPAFEGARIRHGMRARSGAIEKVVFEEDIRIGIIGGVRAQGFCGSGLIDLLAGLLQTGLVSPTGQLLPPQELPDSAPPALRQRVTVNDQGRTEFRVTEPPPDPDAVPIVLTERDVRELQLAVGAIRAGIAILLGKANLGPADLDQVLLAGGFGSFIRRSHAQRIGLLPADIEHPRIRYIGNAALAGAKRALLSTQARVQAETLARRTEHVELSLDPDFHQAFTAAMIFPDK